MNKGELLSNKPIKNIKIIKGDKNINPINEKKKSKILIIFLEPFFLYFLWHLKVYPI